jgi:hypothetical protein
MVGWAWGGTNWEYMLICSYEGMVFIGWLLSLYTGGTGNVWPSTEVDGPPVSIVDSPWPSGRKSPSCPMVGGTQTNFSRVHAEQGQVLVVA